ncbi:MAG: DUF423 domain-containing protein [Gemmatimonadales bacterium]
MDRLFPLLGAAAGFLAVAAGAFGAHALRTRLPPDLLAVFETAARYQMYHALALFAVGWVAARSAGQEPSAGALLQWAGWLFVTGIVLFSGSLYALALTGDRWLGAVTPLGGLAFLAGWLCLAMALWRT